MVSVLKDQKLKTSVELVSGNVKTNGNKFSQMLKNNLHLTLEQSSKIYIQMQHKTLRKHLHSSVFECHLHGPYINSY